MESIHRTGPDRTDVPRYRFDAFVLSPRRRTLLRDGVEQPLIPRYFDLLLFLIERRGEAVHRREIFDRVWSDVIVSDSALSQAIRTIRRALEDDAREVRFVRTVSRHGYEFVFAPVIEEDDAEGIREASTVTSTVTGAHGATVDVSAGADRADDAETLLATLTDTAADEDARRDAAYRLHALGTEAVLLRLESRPGHARARALLRDTRWETPSAGAVPLFGQPQPWLVGWHLVRLRVRAALGLVTRRWASASFGGGMAGVIGGTVGGVLLVGASGGAVPSTVVPVLASVGAFAGGLGGAGVGAGLAVAEAVMRSQRAGALVVGGAVGGAMVGLFAQLVGQWTLAALTGLTPPIGGAIEGLGLGLAAGLSYAGGTTARDGLAAPRGHARLRLAILVSAACGCAALILALAGRPLVGGTLHAIAQSSAGGQAVLTSLGRLIGEPDFGPLTAGLISISEGATFGFGFALGLTRRV